MTLWEWGWVGVRPLGSLGEASEADGCHLSCTCERSTAFTADRHYARRGRVQRRNNGRHSTWIANSVCSQDTGHNTSGKISEGNCAGGQEPRGSTECETQQSTAYCCHFQAVGPFQKHGFHVSHRPL